MSFYHTWWFTHYSCIYPAIIIICRCRPTWFLMVGIIFITSINTVFISWPSSCFPWIIAVNVWFTGIISIVDFYLASHTRIAMPGSYMPVPNIWCFKSIESSSEFYTNCISPWLKQTGYIMCYIEMCFIISCETWIKYIFPNSATINMCFIIPTSSNIKSCFFYCFVNIKCFS